MSGIYTRLHRIFSSTQKSTNPIQKIKPKTPAPKTEQKLPTETSQKSTQDQNAGWKYLVNDLLKETDSKKLFQIFNSLSEHRQFRRQWKLYKLTIHRLTIAKQFTLIEEALESQKKYISEPSGETFATQIIIMYGKAGMFDHAHKVFDEMPERKCQPGVKSFNALLGAANNSQKFDKAIELFREVPLKMAIKPSMDSYNTAAYAFCKLGLLDDAVSLLDEMKANGLKPKSFFFNTLMGGFYEKGNFADGGKMWERMIKSGVDPDMFSYGYKTLGLVYEGKLKEAVELVEELKSKKLKLNMLAYNALIQGFSKADDLDGARKCYDDILEHGCVPSMTTFDTLVPFLCEKGDYGFAFKVCENKFKSLCSVDEATLQNVVDGLVKNSMIEEAKKLVELGRSNSYFPYNLVIHSTA